MDCIREGSGKNRASNEFYIPLAVSSFSREFFAFFLKCPLVDKKGKFEHTFPTSPTNKASSLLLFQLEKTLERS